MLCVPCTNNAGFGRRILDTPWGGAGSLTWCRQSQTDQIPRDSCGQIDELQELELIYVGKKGMSKVRILRNSRRTQVAADVVQTALQRYAESV